MINRGNMILKLFLLKIISKYKYLFDIVIVINNAYSMVKLERH